MLRFHISNKWERQQLEHSTGPIEFGRGPRPPDGPKRYVIRDDLCVSRDHVRVEEVQPGKVRIDNLSVRNPILVIGDGSIAPRSGQEMDLSLRQQVRLAVGETVIEVNSYEDPIKPDMLKTIAQPHRARSATATAGQSLLNLGTTPTPEILTHWFETVIAVQRSAAGSSEFYQQTANALVDLVGLDRGLVLLYRGDDWEVAARHNKESAFGHEYSLTILQQAVQERRTFYLASAALASTTESLHGIEAVVASPIFGAHDEIVGALYGSRTRSIAARGHGIGPLEAQVVQLLASAVGAGLARVEQEAAAQRLRVQFDQFFSPKLARELETNPQLLDGKERIVTVLFSDIRGFSRMAQRLEPAQTCQLVGDVMERLTARVREFDGVIVDFAGDGMLAMWNAPTDQADHAILACRAALAMEGDLPALSAKWREVLGGDLGLGIGINTGKALVGNVGSQHRLKYGPFGHTVNLASRVEGATKQLGIPVLITSSTRELLGNGFATRRLARVRVVGIAGSVDLYELHAESASPEWTARRDAYETALGLFEKGEWAAATHAVNSILAGQADNYDIPSLDLIARCVELIKRPPEAFDPVMELHFK